MATRSRSTRKSAARKGRAGKAAAKKTAAKRGSSKRVGAAKAAKRSATKALAPGWKAVPLDGTVIKKGHVYVGTPTGVKRRAAHIVKKATATEIRSELGISAQRAKRVRDLLATLEARGEIPKV